MSDKKPIKEPRTVHGILVYDDPDPIKQILFYMPKDGEVYVINHAKRGWQVDIAGNRCVSSSHEFEDALFIAKALKEAKA